MTQKSHKSRILVLAAGGSGMSAIAQYLLKNESLVFGMDREFDRGGKIRIKNCLQSMGMAVLHENDTIKELAIDMIVSSPAIDPSHPVLAYASELGIPVKMRNELLASVFNESEESIGISGTSGKTTVTGMLASILNSRQDIYSVFCGDEILNYSTPKKLGNFVSGKAARTVAEIDESDKSLHLYKPSISCITSIEKDHMQVNELKTMFEAFINNSRRVIANIDSPSLSDVKNIFGEKIITVSSKSTKADFYTVTDKIYENRITYTINGLAGELKISGSYNVMNAAIALAASHEAGVDAETAVRALASFKGIRSRFEVKKSAGSYFVLDFAHNPEKIATSYTSAVEIGLPVVYIFQPHGYGPLKFMMNEFSDTFRRILRPGDQLILLKIYDAGGAADRSVHSNDLISRINLPNASYMEKHSDVVRHFIKMKQTPATWVISGARDEKLRDLNSQLVHESRKS